MAALNDISARVTSLRNSAAKAAGSSPPSLEIVRGDATDGVRTLEEGEYRIGTRADCDIVVPDAPAAHFAILKIAPPDPSGVYLSLVPFAPGLRQNGKAVEAFAPVHVQGDATFTLGQTELRFIAPGRVRDKAARAVAVAKARATAAASTSRVDLFAFDPRKMLLAAGLLFGAAFVSSYLDSSGPSLFRASGDAAQPAIQSDQKVSDAGEMMTLIRQQLTVADLNSTIIPRLEGKMIVIEGTVSERQEDRYRTLLANFRRRSPVELRSQVQPVAVPAQAQIAGVSLQPVATVVMQDGGRFQVGDMLPKGWRVEAISDQGVILSRESLRVTVPLGGR